LRGGRQGTGRAVRTSFPKTGGTVWFKFSDIYVDIYSQTANRSLSLPHCRHCVLRGKEFPGDGPDSGLTGMSGCGAINPLGKKRDRFLPGCSDAAGSDMTCPEEEL